MLRPRICAIGVSTFVLINCSHGIFPPEALHGIDRHFDYQAWQSLPNGLIGRKIELGGRIAETQLKNGGVIIVADHLPIVEHPAYGPKEEGKRTGLCAIFTRRAWTLRHNTWEIN
jgi:hypothetical protein